MHGFQERGQGEKIMPPLPQELSERCFSSSWWLVATLVVYNYFW